MREVSNKTLLITALVCLVLAAILALSLYMESAGGATTNMRQSTLETLVKTEDIQPADNPVTTLSPQGTINGAFLQGF